MTRSQLPSDSEGLNKSAPLPPETVPPALLKLTVLASGWVSLSVSPDVLQRLVADHQQTMADECGGPIGWAEAKTALKQQIVRDIEEVLGDELYGLAAANSADETVWPSA